MRAICCIICKKSAKFERFFFCNRSVFITVKVFVFIRNNFSDWSSVILNALLNILLKLTVSLTFFCR